MGQPNDEIEMVTYMRNVIKLIFIMIGLLMFPVMAFAEAGLSNAAGPGLTNTAYGYIAVIFLLWLIPWFHWKQYPFKKE